MIFDLPGWQAELAKHAWGKQTKALAGRKWQKIKPDKSAVKLIQKVADKYLPTLRRQYYIDWYVDLKKWNCTIEVFHFTEIKNLIHLA